MALALAVLACSPGRTRAPAPAPNKPLATSTARDEPSASAPTRRAFPPFVPTALTRIHGRRGALFGRAEGQYGRLENDRLLLDPCLAHGVSGVDGILSSASGTLWLRVHLSQSLARTPRWVRWDATRGRSAEVTLPDHQDVYFAEAWANGRIKLLSVDLTGPSVTLRELDATVSEQALAFDAKGCLADKTGVADVQLDESGNAFLVCARGIEVWTSGEKRSRFHAFPAPLPTDVPKCGDAHVRISRSLASAFADRFVVTVPAPPRRYTLRETLTYEDWKLEGTVVDWVDDGDRSWVNTVSSDTGCQPELWRGAPGKPWEKLEARGRSLVQAHEGVLWLRDEALEYQLEPSGATEQRRLPPNTDAIWHSWDRTWVFTSTEDDGRLVPAGEAAPETPSLWSDRAVEVVRAASSSGACPE